MKLFQMYSGNMVASFWTTVFGVDPGEVPDGARMDFILTNAPRSWGVFVMLGIVAGLVYFCFRFTVRKPMPVAANQECTCRFEDSRPVLALVFLGPLPLPEN